MQLYIIRHAQSYNNALTDWTERVSDPPLTELGERQADALATHLARTPAEAEQPGSGAAYANRTGFRFTRLFTSAMRRALQTAAPIGQAIGMQPEVWVDIHETGGVFLDYHEGRGLPGLKRAEMAEQFPTVRLSPEVTEDGWWNRQRETEEEWQGAGRAGRYGATRPLCRDRRAYRLGDARGVRCGAPLYPVGVHLAADGDLSPPQYGYHAPRLHPRRDHRHAVFSTGWSTCRPSY